MPRQPQRFEHLVRHCASDATNAIKTEEKDGWELVAVVRGEYSTHSLYFKRPYKNA